MSKQNLIINELQIIQSIEKHFADKPAYMRPEMFTPLTMEALLDMHAHTYDLFNWAWCENYVDTLLSLLKDRFCCLIKRKYHFQKKKTIMNYLKR